MTQNLPATPMEDADFTGLEDFGLEDAVIPRLKIVHKEGLFEDNLSGGKYPKIRLIILGMVKQRILWNAQMDGDNDQPMCRSADFENGFPTLEGVPADKMFPWAKAEFNPDHFPPDEDGQVVLPCKDCKLKEWKTHPNGKTPYCTEQWTLSVMYDGFDEETGQWSDTWAVALISLQKSALKAIRAYLTSFTRAKTAAYTAICEVTLTRKTRGQVDYATPNFRGVGKTDQSQWPTYATNAKQMRDYLKRAPEPLDEDGEGVVTQSDNTYAGPQSAPPAADPAPQQPATPAPAQAAAPAAPAQPATPAPVAETPAPQPTSDLPF